MLNSAKEGVSLASKFRGALVGGLLGDCFGAPFENEHNISKVVLQKYFDKIEGPVFKAPFKMYTDDTAMTKCVASSLIHSGLFDERDMAKRFVKEYYDQPRRGYGQNVIAVFEKLRNSKFEDVWLPAREQFGGSGSYGNGGAMRVTPVALFCHHNYNLMLEIAKKATTLTHTNNLGINGALLQCIAVHQSLLLDPREPLDVNKFSTDLITKMKSIEESCEPVSEEESTTPYQDQLKIMQGLLAKDDDGSDIDSVVKTLGNSIAALYSVPTAIYCFLRSLKPIKHCETDNPVRRAIQYSISLGGDTDTIASMAGSISGAYHGYEVINTNLQSHTEAVDKMLSLADELAKATRES